MSRQHLFDGDDTEEILQTNRLGCIDTHAIRRLPYSAEAIDLLLRMLERQPEKRVSAKRALAHPFLQAGEPKPSQRSVNNISFDCTVGRFPIGQPRPH